MESFYKNINSVLEFPKTLILGPTFFLLYFNTLLMMLSVIFLSILTIIVSVLSMIRYLIYGNN